MEYVDWISVRAALAGLFLTVLWVLEGAWPMFLGRQRRVEHYARNIVLGITNGLVVAAAFSGLLLIASEFAREQDFGLLRWTGMTGIASWILAIVLFDMWQYVWHVLNHKVSFLWRFHCVHHSDPQMDASTGLRFHTGEIVLSSTARIAVLPILGLSMVHLAAYEAILLPIVMFHHSNVRVPKALDRILRLVVVTPWMHWVHHSDYRPETDSNYASIFPAWDRLFHTFRLRERPTQIRLGLKDFEEREWRPLRGLLAIPFAHEFRHEKDE